MSGTRCWSACWNITRPLGRRDDLDLHRGQRKHGHLLLNPRVDAWVHRRPARQDDVPGHVLREVDVVVHDRVEARLVEQFLSMPRSDDWRLYPGTGITRSRW